MSTPYPPAPQPVPPPAPKKTSPWVWILGGCGVLVVLIIVVLVAGGLFVAHKAKQAGLDPDLMKKNPGLAVAKMMAAVNPNAEVVSVDEDRGLITIRDKKTGKTVTVNFEDVKRGKISFKDEKGEEFSVQGEGKSGIFSMKTKEGEMHVGGSWNPPSWLPSYAGATTLTTTSGKSPEGLMGVGSFRSNDSLEKILDFYEEALKGAGLEVTRSVQSAGAGQFGSLAARDTNDKRYVNVNVADAEGSRTISIHYQIKD